MSASILVGTCSWADKTLVDSGWYPAAAKTPEQRLRYYADRFPIVEVDSSYYGIPAERNAVAWVERTPEHFVFDVKAYGLLTQHPSAVRALPKDLREALPPSLREKKNIYYKDLDDELRGEIWRRFFESLLPLDSAGKLGVVLFQFPSWFLLGARSDAYIIEAQERLAQYTIAVEFRNGRWLSERNQERTIGLLAERRIPYVCVDEPQGFPSSVPPVTAATASIALLRLHGHNATTWAKKGIGPAERFDYLYTPDELSELTPRVRELASSSEQVHVLFNNCHRDYGVRNAKEMADLLGAGA